MTSQDLFHERKDDSIIRISIDKIPFIKVFKDSFYDDTLERT